jgi:regulatory protein YycI of two-component signal transduction system YycFG
MNKKIASIIFLFIIILSVFVAYMYFNQSNTNEDQYNGNIENISDQDISNEIDDIFLEEDEEIEIGEMI